MIGFCLHIFYAESSWSRGCQVCVINTKARLGLLVLLCIAFDGFFFGGGVLLLQPRPCFKLKIKST